MGRLAVLKSGPVVVGLCAAAAGVIPLVAARIFGLPVLFAGAASLTLVLASVLYGGLRVEVRREGLIRRLMDRFDAADPVDATGLPRELAPLADRLSLIQKERETSTSRSDIAGRLSREIIVDIDLPSGRLWVRNNLALLLGTTAAASVDGKLENIVSQIHPAERDIVGEALQRFIDGLEERFDLVFRFAPMGEDERWAHARAMAVRGADGVAGRVIMLLLDVTDTKREEAARHRASLHDPMTGLPNRTMLLGHLSEALEDVKSGRAEPGALLYLDLDRFKAVNDALGQTAGDDMLRGFARVLRRVIAAQGLVARIGSDQFAVLVPSRMTLDDAVDLAGKLREALDTPIVLAGQEVFATCSTGIAPLVAGYAHAEDVLADAGFAMERAKRLGRGGVIPYRRNMRSHTSSEWLGLESDLRHAVEREELALHYQPIVSLQTGLVAGFEGLLRWNRPGYGAVSPELFVPMAEEIGEIVPIGAWVLSEGCRRLAIWNDRPNRAESPLFLSVNVSRRQIDEPSLMTDLDDALSRYSVDPADLKLEVTESMVMERQEETARTLRALKQRGVTLAIDDFGTGYSSLDRLHALPFDTVKIDRSFVTNLLSDPRRGTIVRAVVDLAHALGHTVVAEGVETKADVDSLHQAGCDLGQGYFYGRPLPVEEADALLRSQARAQIGLAT